MAHMVSRLWVGGRLKKFAFVAVRGRMQLRPSSQDCCKPSSGTKHPRRNMRASGTPWATSQRTCLCMWNIPTWKSAILEPPSAFQIVPAPHAVVSNLAELKRQHPPYTANVQGVVQDLGELRYCRAKDLPMRELKLVGIAASVIGLERY